MSNQIAAQEDSARETQAQRDRDEIYWGDVNTLAAVFRAKYAPMLRDATRASLYGAMSAMGRELAHANERDFARYVFEEHGPGAVLLALKFACDQPDNVISDVVEHP